MTRHARCTLLALATLAATAPILQAQTDESEAQAIRGVVEALAAHAQAGSLDALDTLYAPGRGVHIIEGAGVNHGWAEYRDHHLAPELAEFENFRYRYFGVEPVVRGAVSWASFQYELSTDTSGGHLEVEGRGTAILEKREGRWRVVHLHTSGRRRPS